MKTASVLPIADSDERERLEDWLLIAGQTRDSGPLDQSNFRSILKHLGGESDTVEVLRFGHWACGWIEEIAVHPSRFNAVQDVKEKLENYPIFDEMDMGELELEAEYKAWDSYGKNELADSLQDYFDLMDESKYVLQDYGPEAMYEVHINKGSGDEVGSDGSVNFDFSWLRRFSRDDMAKLLLAARKERHARNPRVQL